MSCKTFPLAVTVMFSDEALLTGRVVIVVEMTCWVAEAAALLVVVAASLVTATLVLLVVALAGVALAVLAALDPVLVTAATLVGSVVALAVEAGASLAATLVLLVVALAGVALAVLAALDPVLVTAATLVGSVVALAVEAGASLAAAVDVDLVLVVVVVGATTAELPVLAVCVVVTVVAGVVSAWTTVPWLAYSPNPKPKPNNTDATPIFSFRIANEKWCRSIFLAYSWVFFRDNISILPFRYMYDKILSMTQVMEYNDKFENRAHRGFKDCHDTLDSMF